MKYQLLKVAIASCLTLPAIVLAQNSQTDWTELKKVADTFPAKAGYWKYVIYPVSPTESKADIYTEIKAGIPVMADSCNSVMLSGGFKAETLNGYGYTYYMFDAGQTISTMMGCSDAKTHAATAYAQPLVIRNLATMPTVIYAKPNTIVKNRRFVPCTEMPVYSDDDSSPRPNIGYIVQCETLGQTMVEPAVITPAPIPVTPPATNVTPPVVKPTPLPAPITPGSGGIFATLRNFFSRLFG